MPDPTRSAPSPSKAERAHTHDNKLAGPLWARAVHRFYDPGFDVCSEKALQGALNDFVALDPAERAFHETHLLYRVVLGLEDVYGVLRRIEKRLDQGGGADLSALAHLAPLRAALEEIARGQPDLVEVGDLSDEDEEQDEDELGDEDELEQGDDSDPDFIYDTVPADEPEQPRRPRRSPQAETPRPEPQRAEPARPKRPADPEREALVGDLVPASEGPRAEAGDR